MYSEKNNLTFSIKLLYNLLMSVLIFNVENIHGEMRLSDYMKRRLGFSTSLLTKVKFGGVTLNGEIVTMRVTVKNGDEIRVELPEEESENVEPMPIELDILYEDEHVLAVNKPRDMPTHPSRGNHLPTLANAVAAYLGVPFVFRAINRLDRGTSGIVLIAKNAYAAAKLGRAMKERKIHQKYVARVVGIPSPTEGRIDAPIIRGAPGEIKRIVAEDGKVAITDYKVTRVEGNGASSLCEITLHTGRTHQIRVHMAHIGHPLVGDFLYGVDAEEGYFLVCSELTFPHPASGEITTVKNR